MLRDPNVVPETKKADSLLEEFKQDRSHLAVVIDEYGSVKGIVTIKDVLEEIVGELATDIDRETVEIMKQKDGSYLIDASIPLRELNKKLNWHTDGYYDEKPIFSWLLHCEEPAHSGGENYLLDHELAIREYIIKYDKFYY